jgi:glycosyltransferase involved in cell wall biosynthesis
MDDTQRLLVLVEHADESEVPLELAAAVEATGEIVQDVCSVRAPDDRTFGLDVTHLRGRTRLDPRSYHRLYGLLGDADVLHVHPNAAGALARVLAAVRGVPVVKTEHNTHRSYGRLKNLVNGATNLFSDVVVAVSGAVAESFGRWEHRLVHAGGGRTVVIHNGVDVSAVRRAADRRVPLDLPDGILVGAGGAHVPQKNLGTLVDAMALLDDDRPGAHLLLTGDGPRRAALEARVRDRGVDDRVTFTGYLPERTAVHALLARLDLYAMPSRHEGFGVAAVEAMAAGLPVVAGDIPPLREVVGEAGVFVPPRDSAALADVLGDLLEDDDRRAQLAAAATERADDFPMERTVRRYLEIYAEVTGGTSGAVPGSEPGPAVRGVDDSDAADPGTTEAVSGRRPDDERRVD